MGERFGGRQKGTPNKATADIKAAFSKHGPELVKAVMKLCKSDDENVRLRALTLALERGFGKAAQAIELSGEVAIERIERVIVDDRPMVAVTHGHILISQDKPLTH